MKHQSIELSALYVGPLIPKETPIALKVMGVFQRGLTAIGKNERQVVYITDRNHPGPFTIYVPNFRKINQEVVTGSQISLEADRISIHSVNTVISLTKAEPYETFKLVQPTKILNSQEPIFLFGNSSTELKFFTSDFFSSYLNLFYAPDQNDLPEFKIDPLIFKTVKDFYKNMKENNLEALKYCAYNLLGFGKGLTPAGDDFLAGWILANFFYHEKQNQSLIFRNISDYIVKLAPSRTHLLSSALIWAASQGAADPFLTEIIQKIMLGSQITAKDLKNLTSVGYSSGFDGLSGGLIYLEAVRGRE